ncbi:MAG: twin-arginine translocase TatA/TatE family subunit [Bacteroidia bacterium]|nr:twin-arginine translocase TatA/TatE family subunit [Bacteroidia bacterium]
MSTVLLGIMGMGTPEIIIIAIVILLMFGGRKIPELMKGLGRGMKEFKDASNGVESKEVNSDEKKK